MRKVAQKCDTSSKTVYVKKTYSAWKNSAVLHCAAKQNIGHRSERCHIRVTHKCRMMVKGV